MKHKIFLFSSFVRSTYFPLSLFCESQNLETKNKRFSFPPLPSPSRVCRYASSQVNITQKELYIEKRPEGRKKTTQSPTPQGITPSGVAVARLVGSSGGGGSASIHWRILWQRCGEAGKLLPPVSVLYPPRKQLHLLRLGGRCGPGVSASELPPG